MLNYNFNETKRILNHGMNDIADNYDLAIDIRDVASAMHFNIEEADDTEENLEKFKSVLNELGLDGEREMYD